jgi:hypothetical protein
MQWTVKSHTVEKAHVIAPSSSRTFKTFAASLKGAWLIYDPAWVFKSLERGQWLSEAGFGHRFDKTPFHGMYPICIVTQPLHHSLTRNPMAKTGKRYYIAPSFSSCPSNLQFRTRYLSYLISDCANGTFVPTPSEADIIFRGDQDEEYVSRACQMKNLT